jgi:hypothetical protein
MDRYQGVKAPGRQFRQRDQEMIFLTLPTSSLAEWDNPANAPDPTLNSKEKAIEISLNGLYLSRRRPTLPHTFACSTIGPAGLNFRVRDGNGWIPRGKITDN